MDAGSATFAGPFHPGQCCPDGYCWDDVNLHNVDVETARGIRSLLSQQREQIARDIEEAERKREQVAKGEASLFRWGMTEAARIARGGAA